MSITCVECGFVNPADSRYCGDCGVDLMAIVSEAPTVGILNDPITSPERSAAPEMPPPRPAIAATAPLPPPTPISAMKTTPPPLSPTTTRIMDTPFVRPESKPAVSSTILQQPEAHLVHLGTGKRLEIPLTRMIAYIGKPNDDIPPDVDIAALPDTDIVSRIHAAIHIQGLKFFLEDSGSSNGTYLNGELLKAGARYRRPLSPGDTITLGRGTKVAFNFELKEF